MKKRTIVTCLCFITALLMTGCGIFASQIPELEESDKDKVVEYASEVLLKYDKNRGDKVGNQPEDFVIQKPEVIEDVEPTPTPEPLVEIPDNEGELPEDVSVTDNTEGGVTEYNTIEGAMGVDESLTFTYEGYEIRDVYPDSIDSYFALTATSGCKLLVVKLKLTNISGQAINVNVPSEQIRFKIVLNGQTKNALTTLLLNDLAFYAGDLEPGASDEVVVLGEYKNDEIASVDSLALVVKTEEGNYNVNLQ